MKAAALELAMERRVEEISVADIADRAGVSRQVVYQHFRDRDDAVAVAVIDAFQAAQKPPQLVGEGAEQGDAPGSSAGDDPEKSIERLTLFAMEHRVLYRNIYPGAASQRTSAAFRDVLRPHCTAVVRRALGERADSGPLDTRTMTDFLVGGLQEVLRGVLEGRAGDADHGEDPDRAARRILSAFQQLLR